MYISPINRLEQFFGPKKAIGDYRGKDSIHDESLTTSLIKTGWKKDIQLVFRWGPASKPTQVLDCWKETLFPSVAAELMRNRYWLFQTILQKQGSVLASLVCCWRFEKVTDLSRTIHFLDFFNPWSISDISSSTFIFNSRMLVKRSVWWTTLQFILQDLPLTSEISRWSLFNAFQVQ